MNIFYRIQLFIDGFHKTFDIYSQFNEKDLIFKEMNSKLFTSFLINIVRFPIYQIYFLLIFHRILPQSINYNNLK